MLFLPAEGKSEVLSHYFLENRVASIVFLNVKIIVFIAYKTLSANCLVVLKKKITFAYEDIITII